MRRHISGTLGCTFQPESDVVLCVGVFEIFTHIFSNPPSHPSGGGAFLQGTEQDTFLLAAKVEHIIIIMHSDFYFFAVITGSEPRASSNNSKSRALLIPLPSLLQQSRKYCVPFWP